MRSTTTVELDTAPREVEVPADLARARGGDPELRRRFDALPSTHRWEHVRAVESAKAEATRERRVTAVLASLRKD